MPDDGGVEPAEPDGSAPEDSPDESGPDESGPGDSWLRFAILFAILAIGFEILYFAVIVDSAFHEAYLEVLAGIAGAALGFLDDSVRVNGPRIFGSGFSVQVAQACDALQTCALLVSAVLAFPVPWSARLRGVVFGLLFLQTVNLIRIGSLYWLGASSTDWFRTAHEVFWPFFIIFVTVATWIAWVRWETRDVSPRLEPAA